MSGSARSERLGRSFLGRPGRRSKVARQLTLAEPLRQLAVYGFIYQKTNLFRNLSIQRKIKQV
jgi:hypothetical protein